MVEEDLGEATIVYEHPGGEPDELTVENEHVVYFQDHWIVKTGENESGDDTVRRIPAQRTYYVEREVEEFEAEVETLVDDVRAIADELEQEVSSLRQQVQSIPAKLLGSEGRQEGPSDVHHIEVEPGESGVDDHGSDESDVDERRHP